MKIKQMPIRYLTIQSIIWTIFIIITILIAIFSNENSRIIWLFIIFPLIWFFSYGFTSQCFHIFWRSQSRILLFSFIFLISFIFTFGYFIDNDNLPELFVITLIWTMLAGSIGTYTGYSSSFFVSEHIIPTEQDINDNSLTFNLVGSKDDIKAQREFFLKFIHKYCNYWKFFNLSENSFVYRTLPANFDLMVKWNSNKIAFFPFLVDGTFFTSAPEVLGKIKLIGENILRLESEKTGNILIKDFYDHAKPHFIIRNIKSVRGNLTIKDIFIIICVFIVLLLVAIYVVNPISFKIGIFTGFITIILTLIVSIFGSLITLKINNYFIDKKKNR